MKKNPFAFIFDQFETRLPESLKPFHTEVKDFSKNLFNEKLAELDLVPRSEFEAQEFLLIQAEQRMAALESRLAVLEKQLK